MYVSYLKSQNYKYQVLTEKDGQYIIQANYKNSYIDLEKEHGQHCCQRIPKTETRGRKHTSFVSVNIIPKIIKPKIEINEKDIDIKTQRGSGPGGQHRNKTDTAVRATHIPTKISCFIDGRSQKQNKEKAINVLKSKVLSYYNDIGNKNLSDKRSCNVNLGKRGNKLRTYCFDKNIIIDHINKKKINKLKKVISGNLLLIK